MDSVPQTPSTLPPHPGDALIFKARPLEAREQDGSDHASSCHRDAAAPLTPTRGSPFSDDQSSMRKRRRLSPIPRRATICVGATAPFSLAQQDDEGPLISSVPNDCRPNEIPGQFDRTDYGDEDDDGLDYDDFSLMYESDHSTIEEDNLEYQIEGNSLVDCADDNELDDKSDEEDSVYNLVPEPMTAGAMTEEEMKTANLVPVKRSWYLIPANHPAKLAWDAFTIIASLLSAYRGHTAIRDRNFHYCRDVIAIALEIWFAVDIFLNFFTEHKDKRGKVIQDGKAVWWRYFTTWFIVDVVSFIPWGRIRVHHIVEAQKKRNLFQKTFFRTKGVVKVSRIIRGRHIKLFGRVAKNTKHVGVGSSKLLVKIIKYVPKYILFARRMKFVLPFKILRMLHFLWKAFKTFCVSGRINVAKRIVISRKHITTRFANQKRRLSNVQAVKRINRRGREVGERLSTAVGGALDAVTRHTIILKNGEIPNIAPTETEGETQFSQRPFEETTCIPRSTPIDNTIPRSLSW